MNSMQLEILDDKFKRSSYHTRETVDPEINMWMALMIDALEDVGYIEPRKGRSRIVTMQMWRNAKAWFLYSGTEVGSLNWICKTISTSASNFSFSGHEIRDKVINHRCRCCKRFIIHTPCTKVRKNETEETHP